LLLWISPLWTFVTAVALLALGGWGLLIRRRKPAA
jgi:hypothetical protein